MEEEDKVCRCGYVYVEEEDKVEMQEAVEEVEKLDILRLGYYAYLQFVFIMLRYDMKAR